jgi:hypothetical protein
MDADTIPTRAYEQRPGNSPSLYSYSTLEIPVMDTKKGRGVEGDDLVIRAIFRI